MKLTPGNWIAIAAIVLTFLAFILYFTQFSEFARCKKMWEKRVSSELAERRCVLKN